MPSSSIIIPFRNLLSVLLFLPLVLSCRQDEPIPPVPPTPGKGETAQMTLSIRVPDFRAANTRGVYEDGITEITVLMFADEGGTEKVKAKYDVPGSSLHTPSGTQDTRVFSVPVTAGTYKRIALIANAQTELAGITAGSTYDALKQVEVTGRFGQAGTGGTSSYIPMYGEHAPAGGIEMKAGVSQTIAQAIPLIRMLARVDIINPATSGAATVGEVYFVNSVGNGRVWVDLATYNTGAAQSGYMNPTLPGTLQKANASDPLLGVGSSSSPNVITYYLNEQPATSASLTTYNNNRPCIVMILHYQGRQYYYRLDYTWDGIKGGGASPYEKGKYMPLLRNHRYIFTIKEVKGPGFLTMEDALNSPENFTNHNIVVVPIVIDEAFTDITFNESGYFLAVTRTAMTLKGRHDNTSTQNKFSVRTNYPGGYKITANNADGTGMSSVTPWLSPSRTSGAAGATLTNPITEEVQALTNGRGVKDGYLEVHAGRLYTKVNVVQFSTPLEYVAEFNLAGGSQYGTIPHSGIPVTTAQTDNDLRWAINHDNNQSGFYNAYVLNGQADATINPTGKNIFDDPFFSLGNPGYGYHLPSRQEWIGVFSRNNVNFNSSGNHMDSQAHEACQFGDVKKTFDSEYSSPGNGICYALRFKQATGTPNDGSSVSDFPLATDNKMCCAFRYDKIGRGGSSFYIKVSCVYLGEAGASMTIGTFANETWWVSHSAETTIRFFPVTGFMFDAPCAGTKGVSQYGKAGGYWSTQLGHVNAYYAEINSQSVGLNNIGPMSYGFPVRLFASE